VVVPRWVQASLLTLALLVLIALAWAAAPVLLTFVVAGIIALVINTLVELLQRARVPRGLAIAAVFVGFFAALAGVVALLIRPITNQAVAFQDDPPALIDSANAELRGRRGGPRSKARRGQQARTAQRPALERDKTHRAGPPDARHIAA
jgi:predicted PurR-regulated permease PerM